MAFHGEILAECKKKLEDEKARLEKELERLGKPTDISGDYETRFQEIGDNWEENASEVEQYGDDLAVETTLEAQLKEIYAALDRIERGTYGVCEKGGEEISIERLRAYPAARTCVAHA